MGFSIHFNSTRRIAPRKAESVRRSAEKLCRGRTSLGCEPVTFHAGSTDGHLSGSSKPNLLPADDDCDLPNGNALDLLDILCQLSREHRIDWEIGHDYSNGAIGYIRKGVCDEAVFAEVQDLVNLGEFLSEMGLGDDTCTWSQPPHAPYRRNSYRDDENPDDGPRIIPFRPRGS